MTSKKNENIKIFILSIVIAIIIFAYARNESHEKNDSDVFNMGEIVYMTHCSTCHAQNGKGIDGVGPKDRFHTPTDLVEDRSHFLRTDAVLLKEILYHDYCNKNSTDWKKILTNDQILSAIKYARINFQETSTRQFPGAMTPRRGAVVN